MKFFWGPWLIIIFLLACGIIGALPHNNDSTRWLGMAVFVKEQGDLGPRVLYDDLIEIGLRPDGSVIWRTRKEW